MNIITIADLLELCELAKTEDHRDPYLLQLPWGQAPYYNFLFLLTNQMKPDFIVELGVSRGTGTANLSAGAPTAHICGVDINLGSKDVELNLFPSVDLHEGDSMDYLHTIIQPHGKPCIDLLFIDTDHTTEQCLKEYRGYLPYMRKGGIVLFDDIFMEGMSGVWPAIAEPKVILLDLHAHLGFGAAIIE